MNASIFFSFLFITFLSFCDLSAQVLWLEPNGDSGILKDRITNLSHDLHSGTLDVNFHLCPAIDIGQFLDLDMPSLNQCNIFTVFKSKVDAKESLVWKLQDQSKDQLLFTDHRIVDLTKGKFMNFIDHSPDQAQVYSYQHHRSEFKVDKLFIGTLPNNGEIPVKKFDGSLAELIIFNRVLAPTTRKAVESYLALKYSSPLQLGEDYLTMSGDLIWDASQNNNYPYRVAGIGRQDALGLYQKQSSSEIDGGLLSIALGELKQYNHENMESIRENTFMLWSDDGGSLDFIKMLNQPFRLQRSWKLNAAKLENKNISLQLKHQGLLDELTEGEQLWLSMSNTGSSSQTSQKTDYYMMDLLDDKSASILIPINPTVYEFGFLKAPEFWAALDVDFLSCEEEDSGQLEIQIMGGVAPYEISIKSQNEDIYSVQNFQERIHLIKDLDNSIYQLELIDANGSKYATSVSVSSEDLLLDDIELASNASAEELQQYFKTFEKILGASYQWVLPDGQKISQLEIDFDQTGTYLLEVMVDDCKAWKQFEVTEVQNNIVDMFINPNPSSTGYFKLSAQLKVTAPYSIDVTTMDGKTVFFQEFTNEKFIEYHGQLSKPGLYNIRLQSNGFHLTKKLIVVR